jgi:acyl carrier protein phosphodiesterase
MFMKGACEELYMTGGRNGKAVNNFVHVNYLAHFYLAHPNEDLMFGNYIGDGVKGSMLEAYSHGVQRGIRFHRFIDTFTDANKLVLEAKKMFYPSQSKFSPVVVDVWFDHLLAQRWEEYSATQLHEFATRCYQIIDRHPEPMPDRSAGFYRYMVSNNILQGYAKREGILKVFRGMDSRTKFNSNMADSLTVVEKQNDKMNDLFAEFFPELMKVCAQWKEEH